MVDAYDAIVIGGGILGVTTTYNLARAGQKVALLEANTIAKAASNNSFAWLNSHGKDPGPYHDLNVAGMKEYSSLEERVHTVDVHRTGSLYWAASKADDDFLINAQWFFMDYLFLFNTLQLEEGNCLKNFAQVYTYSIHKN